MCRNSLNFKAPWLIASKPSPIVEKLLDKNKAESNYNKIINNQKKEVSNLNILISNLKEKINKLNSLLDVYEKKDKAEKIKNLQLRLNTKVNSQIQSKKENYEYLNKFLKSPSLIVNNYKEKLLDDFKNLTLSIENKFSISKLNLLNLGKSIIAPNLSINLN